MLLIIAGILAILWLAGFIGHVGGGFIHLVLVVAIAVFVYHLIMGRRASV